jgi:hypothetical protein
MNLAWQLDDPESYKTTNLIKLNSEKYILSGKNAYCNLSISIRWIDKTYTMALWKFKRHFPGKLLRDDEIKWVMCPLNKMRKFKVVNCISNDTVKTPEKQFLPINLN